MFTAFSSILVPIYCIQFHFGSYLLHSVQFWFLFTAFSSILVHVYCIQFHNKLIPFYCIQLNFDSYLWVLHSVQFWFLCTAFSSILISIYCIQFHFDSYIYCIQFHCGSCLPGEFINLKYTRNRTIKMSVNTVYLYIWDFFCTSGGSIESIDCI